MCRLHVMIIAYGQVPNLHLFMYLFRLTESLFKRNNVLSRELFNTKALHNELKALRIIFTSLFTRAGNFTIQISITMIMCETVTH